MVGPAARVYTFPLVSVIDGVIAAAESNPTVATMRFPVVLAPGRVFVTALTALPFVAFCWTNAGAGPFLTKFPAQTLTPVSARDTTWLRLASAVVKFIVNPSGSIDTRWAFLVTASVLSMA